MITKTKRSGCLLAAAVFLLALPVAFLIGNSLSGHKLQAHLEAIGPFTWVMQTGKSHDGRYDFHIMGSGIQGATYWVRIARPWSFTAREVMRVGTEDFVGSGPLSRNVALAWSRSDNRVALICKGWYTDCYDISKRKGDRFPRGLYSFTNKEELRTYHEKVVEFLGENPTIIGK